MQSSNKTLNWSDSKQVQMHQCEAENRLSLHGGSVAILVNAACRVFV